MQNLYTKILIRDLTLEMSIGIHAHEKEKKQRVVINIALFTDHEVPKSINDAVCYETVTNEIEALCSSKHYDLVEVLAEDIAQICLSKSRVEGAEINILKPDIMPKCDVGIDIFRTK